MLPLGAHAASDPGVNWDPGSPAAKEYAIPLAQGRADGAGTDNQQAAANTAFGVGLKPPSGGAGAGKGSRAGKTSRAGSAGGKRSGAAKAAQPAVSPALASQIAKAEAPGGTTVLTLGMALAVLLAAAALAVALRGRLPHRAA